MYLERRNYTTLRLHQRVLFRSVHEPDIPNLQAQFVTATLDTSANSPLTKKTKVGTQENTYLLTYSMVQSPS